MADPKPILFSGPMVRAILGLDGVRKTQTRRLMTPGTAHRSTAPWTDLDFDAHVQPDLVIGRGPDGAWITRPNPRGTAHRLGCYERGYCCTWLGGHKTNGGEYLRIPAKDGETAHRVCPRIVPGDFLYVRETWQAAVSYDDTPPSHLMSTCSIRYRADGSIRGGDRPWGKVRPGIHLPRALARIFLRVTEVRAERLQWITGSDVLAEGIDSGSDADHCDECWNNGQRMAFEQLWDGINGDRASWASNPWVWVIGFEIDEVRG